MLGHSSRIAVIATVVTVTLVAGCGGGDPEQPTLDKETVDKLPKLHDGWHEYVNHRAGFAIGRAPGWRAKLDGATTTMVSPDQLVAISISADRTDEAIAFPLDEFALETIEALTVFDDLEVGEPEPFRAHYEAESVEATGTTEDGVRQKLELIAMRREQLVTYTLLIARNVERPSGFYASEALEIVRTLRGRPIG